MNEKFYKDHCISRTHFAEIARVGRRSLLKYEHGLALRPTTIRRIETAIRVIEKHDLNWPVFSGGDRYLFMYESDRCDMLFQKLMERES